jgi:hypothetical protein
MKRELKRTAFTALFLSMMLWTTHVARAERVQLTSREVQNIFIGKPWHTSDGAFFFSPKGAYTYKPFDSPQAIPWLRFTVQNDGTLAGPNTSYTFFKTTFGYQYYHSNSKRYWPARPNKKFQDFMREGP